MRLFSYLIIVGYWKGDKSNWELDRRGRRRLFDVLKGKSSYQSESSQSSKIGNNFPNKHSWNSRTTSPLVSILLAIVKVGLLLFIFYAAAMFISHGKHWP